MVEPLSIVSAFIGGTNALIKVREYFRRKPIFQINKDSIEFTNEEPDKRWGIIEDEQERHWLFSPRFYPQRQFLNIKVSNKGFGIARECEISIKLIKKIPSECTYPTQEFRSLCWQDGNEKINIEPTDAKKFHLLFTQDRLSLEQIFRIRLALGYCEVAKDKPFPIAWLGTIRALKNQEFRREDDFCYGKFVFHLNVKSINDAQISKHITVRLENKKSFYPLTEVTECNCHK